MKVQRLVLTVLVSLGSCGLASSQNLVINGDFQAGNTGFSSDYIYSTPNGWLLGGRYAIASDPQAVHSMYADFGDHTSGSGKMLVVHGEYGTGATESVCWRQTIHVSPHTFHIFSFWATMAHAGPAAEFEFHVNGVRLEPSVTLPDALGEWKKYATVWESGASTRAVLELYNTTTTEEGSDFALDDIACSPMGQASLTLQTSLGLAYATPSTTGRVYRLVARDTPFNNQWYPLNEFMPGTGDTIKGFERGTNDVFLPSRAWEITKLSDGWSLQFDGINDFAFAGHNSMLSLSSGLTLESWIKPNATGTRGVLLAKAISEAVTCYSLERDAAGHARLRLYDGDGSNFVDLASTLPLPVDAWSHVAASYDGAVARLYINGVADVGAAASAAVRISSISPLCVGSILGAQPLSGLLDDIRVWSRARSAAEILDTYESGDPSNSTGLVGHWPLSEASGQIVADIGPNGLHLLLGDSAQVDATDPVWFDESYSMASQFDMIWEFGTPAAAFHWDSQLGATYTVQSTDQPGNLPWFNRGPPLTGTGETLEFFDDGSRHAGFYRVVAEGLTPQQGLYFAGLQWEDLRVDFEIANRAFSSVPRPAEGFDYGHWGNGRGPMTVTHVGDTSWTDYSLELDIELLPPSSAWNPYDIQPCYRSGGVTFRAASFQESWNAAPGQTCYVFAYSTSTCDSYQQGDWQLLRFHDHYYPGTGWSAASVGTRHELLGGNSAAIVPGPNHLRIDAIGNKINIWANGTLIVSYTDSVVAGGPVLYGGIGFNSNFESMVTVTHLTVTPVNDLDAGLIAYYPLDGNALDATGNGHDGTTVGTVFNPNGAQGGAFSFDGSTSYIRIPDHPELDPPEFTVSVWVRKESESTEGGAIGKHVHGAPSGHRILFEPDGNVRFSMTANGNLLSPSAMRVPFSAYFGDWTMVTYSYNGTSAKQYINGQLAVESPFSGGSMTMACDLIIGAGAVDYDGVTPMQMFLGDIDEVRFYNRALSAAEVEALYQSQVP